MQLFDGQDMLGDAATVDEDGNWSVQVTLTDGTHQVTAVDTDLAGNASAASEPVSYTVDATAPDAPAFTSVGSALTNLASQTIIGTGEIGSTVQLFDGQDMLGDAATVDEDGNWSVQVTLTDGTHQVTAVDTDLAGNASAASEPVSYTVDATAPTAPVITTAGGLTNVAAPTITGAGEAGSLVQLFNSMDPIGGPALVDDSGHWRVDVELGIGPHSLSAVDTDAAGNQSEASTAVAYTVLPNVDPVSSEVLPMIDPEVHGGFQITNATLGLAGGNMGEAYTGVLDYLQSQLIWNGTQGIAVTATQANVFLHGGSGDDALQVTAGSNVLDGGDGSNFLVGAMGTDGETDTFFVDARTSAPTWSTVVNFHAGDKLAIWGFADDTSQASWAGQDGVGDFTGATLRAVVNGHGSSVTFAGLTDAAAQGLSLATGTIEGQNYLLVTRTS